MTWNERLKKARTDLRPKVSVQRATFEAWLHLPEGDHRLDPKTLSRYEKDWPEEKADAWFVLALCKVYGVELIDISGVLAERVGQLSSLVASSGSSCYAMPQAA